MSAASLELCPAAEVEFSLQDDVAILRPAPPADANLEVADFMDHIRRHKGSMDLGGMTGDEFFRLLRD